jgi:hypothetical protein
MNKLNYIFLVSLIALFVVSSCQKEVVNPASKNGKSSDFVLKNGDGTTEDEEDYRADKSHDEKANDDESSDGKIVVVSNDKVIIIDNITDPNNDEDEKSKVGLKK